jgi:outer membrane protein assembly factor BamB
MNNAMIRSLAGFLVFGCAAGALADDKAKPRRGDSPMWGGSPDRNMASDETGMPAEWNIKGGTNIKWSAPLGSQSYGNPVIAAGRVLVGTNNHGTFRAKIEGDKGVLLCFDEKTGKLLWQITHDKLGSGRVNDWPEQGICSAPVVEDGKLYYVSNRCELVCADLEGFLDGENDGPFTKEKYNEKEDGDFIWVLDMIEQLGVFPHNLATSSPVIAGDNIFILTSNGVDEGHLNLPAPEAPSVIAVNKKTGKLVWKRSDPGDRVMHGQWSSPAYGMIGGTPQVVVGTGDGIARGLEPSTGDVLWSYEMNPKDAEYVLGGRGTKSYIVATPVIADDKVYLAVGQDPEHGEGVGHLHCIDATKRGDITQSGRVWHYGGEDFGRTVASCAVKDGLCYAVDLSGYLNCLDAKTGELQWKYDTRSAAWGSPYVVDGKVYLGIEDGEVLVLEHGRKQKLIAKNDMGNSMYTTPVAANGVLFINSRNMLFAIEVKK